jgi:hypothetical protein
LENLGIDPHNIWIDLCTGAEYAQPIFQTYLKTYVESSVTLRPCLGPKEYELVRTINSGATVEDTWTHLVNEADRRVLRAKRIEDQDNASFWHLLMSSRNVGSGKGPAYEIARVSASSPSRVQ